MSEKSTSTDLADLLARTALRDRKAFAALYAASSAKLFGVIHRILGEQAVAEETLQEVYLKIWQRAGDYRADVSRPMTWMISIARFRAIDVLRARGRHELPGSDDALLTLADPQAGPQTQAEQAGEAAHLQDCLDELPEQRRQCLQLAYCEGYTQEELSEHLGSPLGTIKSWIRRGLLSLRDCLEARHV